MQLESFKSAPVAEKKQKSSAAPKIEDTVKYELYVKPDQAKLEQASKVSKSWFTLQILCFLFISISLWETLSCNIMLNVKLHF